MDKLTYICVTVKYKVCACELVVVIINDMKSGEFSSSTSQEERRRRQQYHNIRKIKFFWLRLLNHEE